MIEIEHKYAFDPKDRDAIRAVLDGWHSSRTSLIRQFYDADYRYRHDPEGYPHQYVQEDKKKIKVRAPWVASTEISIPMTENAFENGYQNSQRRLMKLRYTVERTLRNGLGEGQCLFVDFFLTEDDFSTLDIWERYRVYAIVAEVEVMIGPDTRRVDLRLDIPEALRQFVLLDVGRCTDDELKSAFSSKQLTDNTKGIRAITDIYLRLRNQCQDTMMSSA